MCTIKWPKHNNRCRQNANGRIDTTGPSLALDSDAPIIMSSMANAIAINLKEKAPWLPQGKTNRKCSFRTRLVRQGMTDDTYCTYINTFSTQMNALLLLNSPLCIRVSSLIRTRPSKRNNPSRSIAFFRSRASTAHTSPASMRHVFPSHGHFASE